MATVKRILFNSMPNFRFVGGSLICGTTEKPVTNRLYRSSRPDFLQHDEVTSFVNLELRSILDFRSAKEYKKANGTKFLDQHFKVYKVIVPSNGYSETAPVKFTPVRTKLQPVTGTQRKHYLIDFFNINYVWAIYNRAPWFIKLYSLLWLLVDVMLNTGYRYFVQVFATNVLNKGGLLGNYIDMLTYSQASICAALKLLADPENLPAMINCAHGKDRTGIVSAMVLSCLGRSKEEIARDYALSEEELLTVRERVYEEVVDRFHMCKSFITAKEDTMLQLLDYIEKTYGSIPEYLESIGFSRKDQESLRNNIIR